MSYPSTPESGRSDRPNTVDERARENEASRESSDALARRARENAAGIAAMLVLGLGFLALFGGFELFFLVWIIGFAVVVPIVAMLFEDEEREAAKREAFFEDLYRGAERLAAGIGTLETGEPHHGASGPSRTDALATLRDRYARGELTDEQFERKLDALLGTDTPENAIEWREREREGA